MAKAYQYPCGCQFEILGYKENGRPNLKVDFDNIPFDCPAVWEAYAAGHNKVTFQTEKHLGKQWSTKIKPTSIEHLAALVSLIRPVTIKSYDENNISMTDHYARRKNFEEDVEYFHPLLEPFLKETYGIACYQEQLMRITQVLAGFNLQEADSFRKATGKKDAKLMTEVKAMFFAGCRKVGALTEAEMARMWDILEKANRYSFNKSHAVAYAITSYQTMYSKVHFPSETLLGWLTLAHRDQDPRQEVRSLVGEARRLEILVRPPSLANLNAEFELISDVIYFGQTNIKGVGQAQIKKLQRVVTKAENNIGPMKGWTWFQFLLHVSAHISSTVVRALISVGALPFSLPRSKMLFEYDSIWLKLTDKETAWMMENVPDSDSVIEGIKALALSDGGTHNKNRHKIVCDLVTILERPPVSLQDTPRWIAQTEDELLGISLTCSKSGSRSKNMATSTCKDFATTKKRFASLAVDIVAMREFKTKRGGMMAFLSVEDETGSLDNITVFSEPLTEHSDILFEGNSVLIEGKRDKKYDSLIVDKAWQI